MTLSHISNAMQALDVSHTKKQRPAPTRTPVAPDAFVPNALHRSHDGWMTVERKVGADWQTLGSVPARHVGGLFSLEAVAEACQVDSYFSLHGMFAPGQWRQKHTVPGLAPVRRNVNSVRWLTCCHVDLDAYRSGMDSHGAIAAIMRLVDAGTLPLCERTAKATQTAHSHDGQRCRTPCTLCVQPSGLIQQQSTVQRSHGFQGRSIQRMAGVSHTQSTSITRGSHTATISQRLSSGFFHTWHHSRPSRRLHGSSPRTRSVHALPSRDGTEGGTD